MDDQYAKGLEMKEHENEALICWILVSKKKKKTN